MKVIIVGGVAGGASCAARLRRLDEKAEIIMVERGPYVSYANCGLPYHVGGVIEKESSLLVANRTDVPRHVRDRCADELRGHRDRSEEEDCRSAQCQNRRGDDRVLRQARTVARRGFGSSAPAGHRSAGNFSGANRTRREDDPRVDREGHDVSRGHVQLLRHSDASSPCGARWSSAAGSSVSRRRRTWFTSGST